MDTANASKGVWCGRWKHVHTHGGAGEMGGEITRVIHDVITMWFLVLTTGHGTGKMFAANEDEGYYWPV